MMQHYCQRTFVLFLAVHRIPHACIALNACSLRPTPRADNLIENMQACGIAIMESFNIEISGNTVDGAQYGIRMTTGSSDNMVYENSFDGISKGGMDVQVQDERVDLASHERFRFYSRCSCQDYGSRVCSQKFVSTLLVKGLICSVAATKASPVTHHLAHYLARDCSWRFFR